MKRIRKKYNRTLLKLLWKVNPVKATKYFYKISLKKELDLKNPRDLNEKIMWLKHHTYWNSKLIATCADKYEVRNYVKECGHESILNKLYGVYDSIDQINWEILPDQFVIKTTNASRTNIVCTDKKQLERENIEKTLEKSLKTIFGKTTAEFQYALMKPRVIIEKYLGKENGELPMDYKIWCFHGIPKYVIIHSGREKGIHSVRMFDMNFQEVYFLKNSDNSIKQLRPDNFEKMIEVARDLSQAFPFVRVDLYDVNNQIIFGELTFTPGSGVIPFFKDEALLEMGKHLKLEV